MIGIDGLLSTFKKDYDLLGIWRRWVITARSGGKIDITCQNTDLQTSVEIMVL